MKKDNAFQKFIRTKRFALMLSVFLACVLWFFVANTVANEITREIVGIPIDLTAQIENLNDLGMKLTEVENVTATVEVNGSRSDVGGLSADDIEVTASLAGVSGPGEYNLRLSGSRKDSEAEYQIVSISPTTIKVRIDQQGTETFEPIARLSNVELPEGYMMEQYYVTPGEISVTASSENLAKIDHIDVLVEATEPLTKSTVFQGTPVLYDAQGEELDQSSYVLSTEEITVSVVVLKQKTLNLTFEFTHVPEGLDTSAIPCIVSSSTIDVAGPAEQVDALNEIFLGYIDLRQVSPGETFTFDVVLPDGFLNIKNINTCFFRFDMEEYDVITLDVDQINLINVPDGLEVELDTPHITGVQLVGPAEVLETVSADDLIAELDLSKYEITPGQYNLVLEIVIPERDNVWTVGEYTAVISVTQPESSED